MNGEFQLSWERLPQDLWTLLIDPGSNLGAALTLYAIIGTLFVIILVIAILFIMSTPEEEEHAAAAAGGTAPGAGAPERAEAPQAPPRTPRAVLATAGIWIAILALVWVATGYASSTAVVCEGCHVTTPHAQAAEGTDPHESVTCVACHEPGGLAGRFVLDVPARVLHVTDGMIERTLQEGYGQVSRSSCESCHRGALDGVTFDEARGLRMSHAEPLEAAARCLDCHTLRDGVVGAHNAGMNPCLRCHDSQTASAECSTCHDRNAAAAARPRTASFAAQQVEQPRCGSCHDEERYCDPCHGTRMPHSNEFMAYAHARPAAIDFWTNRGRMCAQCHTRERRSCQQCHTNTLGSGHGPGLRTSHVQAEEPACNRCHQRWAFNPQRDFCVDVCHSEAAIEASRF